MGSSCLNSFSTNTGVSCLGDRLFSATSLSCAFSSERCFEPSSVSLFAVSKLVNAGLAPSVGFRNFCDGDDDADDVTGDEFDFFLKGFVNPPNRLVFCCFGILFVCKENDICNI